MKNCHSFFLMLLEQFHTNMAKSAVVNESFQFLAGMASCTFRLTHILSVLKIHAEMYFNYICQYGTYTLMHGG